MTPHFVFLARRVRNGPNEKKDLPNGTPSVFEGASTGARGPDPPSRNFLFRIGRQPLQFHPAVRHRAPRKSPPESPVVVSRQSGWLPQISRAAGKRPDQQVRDVKWLGTRTVVEGFCEELNEPRSRPRMQDSKLRARLKAQLTKFSSELCAGLSRPIEKFVNQMLFGITTVQDSVHKAVLDNISPSF
jgi:hypothetical protein